MLANELMNMYIDDQKYLNSASWSDEADESLFIRHAERLKEIIREHGWPTISMVGRQPALGAWIIVQHADHDHPFQVECLPLLTEAVRVGDAEAWQLAYLVDRVLVNAQQKQVFGTQLIKSIFDYEHVDERRALFGMRSLASYWQNWKLHMTQLEGEGTR